MAGTQLEIIEETDDVQLVVARPIKTADLAACADFCTTFLSFDARLKKRAHAAGLSPLVETPKA